jgi:hypothetical protein
MIMMKSTLTLLLCVAVVTLMVLPASATAPKIDELPRVVIGSTGTFDQVLKIDAYVDWHPGGANADYDEADFYVFLYDDSGSRTLTDGMIGTEATDLDGGAKPAAAGLNAYGQLVDAPNWLDLAYTGLPGSMIENDVVFYASVEDDNGVTTSGMGMMTVVTEDPTQTANQSAYGIEFQGGGRGYDSMLDWWDRVVVAVPGEYGGVTLLNKGTTGLVGWNAGDSLATADQGIPAGTPWGFGTYTARWVEGASSYISFIPQDGGGLTAPVFEAKMTLANTCTNYVDGPGYRYLFLNGAWTHTGSIVVLGSVPDDYGMNTPYAGNPFQARLYWATPGGTTGVTGMQDSAAQIQGYTAPLTGDGGHTDGRDYGIEVNIVDFAAAVGGPDWGQFTIEALSVHAYESTDFIDDTDPTLTQNWVSNGTKNFAEWALNKADLSAGGIFGAGDARTDTNGDLLIWAGAEAGGGTGPRFEMANPDSLGGATTFPGGPAYYIPINENALVRFTTTVRSEAADTAPVLRLYIATQNITPDIAKTAITAANVMGRGIDWTEFWGAQAPQFKQTTVRGAGQENPGVPKATGSVLNTYCYMHSKAADPDPLHPPSADFLFPQIQVYTFGTYGGTTAWPDEDGYLAISGLKMSQLTKADGSPIR